MLAAAPEGITSHLKKNSFFQRQHLRQRVAASAMHGHVAQTAHRHTARAAVLQRASMTSLGCHG